MLERAPDDRLLRQWARVRGRLREEFGDAAFKSWLKPMVLQEVRDAGIRIAVPTRFMRDWVANHYGSRLATIWNEENSAIRAVDVIVAPSLSSRPFSSSSEPKEMATSPCSPRLVRFLMRISTLAVSASDSSSSMRATSRDFSLATRSSGCWR